MRGDQAEFLVMFCTWIDSLILSVVGTTFGSWRFLGEPKSTHMHKTTTDTYFESKNAGASLCHSGNAAPKLRRADLEKDEPRALSGCGWHSHVARVKLWDLESQKLCWEAFGAFWCGVWGGFSFRCCRSSSSISNCHPKGALRKKQRPGVPCLRGSN